jgi:hypothetical protein
MGTDIHMACEVRRNGEWTLVTDKVFKNVWYSPNSHFSFDKEQYTCVPYDSRNYNMFAMLAGVRNGRGFAGVKIGEEFNPISEPKGYPDDMCAELMSDIDGSYEEWDDDRPHLSNEHSASWLTLKELLDYDWEQLHCNYGCVSEDVYRDFVMQCKHPDSWSGGISGPNIVHISEQEMVNLIDGILLREDGKQYYTSCYFVAQTYKDCAGSFYDNTIPDLQALVPEGGTTEDVRVVFDFDS